MSQQTLILRLLGSGRERILRAGSALVVYTNPINVDNLEGDLNQVTIVNGSLDLVSEPGETYTINQAVDVPGGSLILRGNRDLLFNRQMG